MCVRVRQGLRIHPQMWMCVPVLVCVREEVRILRVCGWVRGRVRRSLCVRVCTRIRGIVLGLVRMLMAYALSHQTKSWSRYLILWYLVLGCVIPCNVVF